MPLVVALNMEAFEPEQADARTASVSASLASAFESLGCAPRIRYMDKWGEDDLDVDLAVHVGGKIKCALKKWNVNLLILSGAEAGVRIEDIKRYDAVLANGPELAAALRKTGVTAIPGPDASAKPEEAAARALALYEGLEQARERAVAARDKAGESLGEGPLVSVLMSTYNRREFLPSAVRSVLGQTYANLELVLVNDGGEYVEDIVRGFGDERIRHVRLPERGGKARAVNTAFTLSRGEFIAHLDDDDAWYPFHLESLMLALTGIEGVRMAYSDAWRVEMEHDGHGYRETGREIAYRRQVDIGDLLEYNSITGISVCHDRALFEEAGGMDERLSALIDWDLWRRMAALTRPYHVSRATAEYFVRGGTSTSGGGHITNMNVADPPRYAAHRALIINKRLKGLDDGALLDDLKACRGRSRAEFLIARAGWREERGEYAEAQKALALARAKDGGAAHVHRAAGNFHLRRGEPVMALSCFQTAMGMRDACEIDFLNAARALYSLGLKDEAGRLLESMGKRFNSDEEVRNMIDEYVRTYMDDETDNSGITGAA